MKYLTFIIVIAFAGCSKSTTTNSNNSIIGRWIETAYLADPGDGSGTWQPDNSDTYIIFNEDSSAESNVNPYFGNLQSYHILSDSTLSLEYTDGTIFSHAYKIENNVLTLTGGCIEACGVRYIKAPTM